MADFLAGLVHWYEDKVLDKALWYTTLEQISKDNELHHLNPVAMTRFSMWENIKTTAVITLPLSVVLYFLGLPMIVWLTVFFGTFGNLVHRFAHLPKGKRPAFVRFMQKTGLFITFEQHNKHHFEGKNVIKKEDAKICYCPMTTWLNPLLDKINFWSFLERLRG